jgi:hypothetical protein
MSNDPYLTSHRSRTNVREADRKKLDESPNLTEAAAEFVVDEPSLVADPSVSSEAFPAPAA